jgi:hypothetical protein
MVIGSTAPGLDFTDRGLATDPVEIGVKQLEPARTDSTRTAITIRTQQQSPLRPGEVIRVSFE